MRNELVVKRQRNYRNQVKTYFLLRQEHRIRLGFYTRSCPASLQDAGIMARLSGGSAIGYTTG
jgi:hypothetical protein